MTHRITLFDPSFKFVQPLQQWWRTGKPLPTVYRFPQLNSPEYFPCPNLRQVGRAPSVSCVLASARVITEDNLKLWPTLVVQIPPVFYFS